MIKLNELLPEVYYNQSRDFQFICHIFEIALNYARTNVDIVKNIYNVKKINADLLNTLALTLGIKLKHKYNTEQLKALCACFSYLLKNKGNKEAVETLANCVAHAEGINMPIEVDYSSPYELCIILPDKLTDISLFKDTLDYILPAGFTFRIKQTGITPSTVKNYIGVRSVVKVGKNEIVKTGNEYQTMPQLTTSPDYTYSNTTIKITDAATKAVPGIGSNIEIPQLGGNSNDNE